MEVVIVMPVYNEEECITQVLLEWCNVLSDISAVLLVIDDGSKDQTAQKISSLLEKYPQIKLLSHPNCGHGPSIYRGYQEAIKMAPNYVFQTDSDNQIPASEFPKLWAVRQQNGYCAGVRAIRHDPILRKRISKILALTLGWIFGVKLRDANCPFRLIATSQLANLLPRISPQSIIPNILLSLLAAKKIEHFQEVEVIHHERQSGVGSLNLRKLGKFCWQALKELMIFR